MAYVCITYVFINNISLFFYQQMLVLLEMLVEGSEPTTSPPSLLPSPFPNHWINLISPIATKLKDEPHENKPYSRYYSNLNTIYNICKTTSL